MYYKNYEGKCEREVLALQLEIERLEYLAKSLETSEKINLKDFGSQAAVRGLTIGAAMAWFLQLSGCFIIINYSSLVFLRSDHIIDPQIASIILGVVQIFGGLLSTSLSDNFGRKFLLILSLMGSAFGLFGLSLYLYFDHIGYDLSQFSSLPLVLLSFVIFTSCAGIAPLSNVCTVENLPPKVNIIIIKLIFYSFSFALLSFAIIFHSLPIIDSNIWYGTVYAMVQLRCISGR